MILLSNQRLKPIHRPTIHINRTDLRLIIRSQDAQIDGAALCGGFGYGRRILGYGHAEDCRRVEGGDGGLGRGGGCEVLATTEWTGQDRRLR